MPLPDPPTAASTAAAFGRQPALAPAERRWRLAAAVLLLALIMLGLCWELWLAPTGSRSWALKVLPLALPLGGVLAGRVYAYRVLSLLVWAYVAEGLVRATSEAGAAVPLAWAQAVLALALFVAVVGFIRAGLASRREAG